MNLSRRQFLGLLPAIPMAAMAVVKAKREMPRVVREGVGCYRLWVTPTTGAINWSNPLDPDNFDVVSDINGITMYPDPWPYRYDYHKVLTG